MQNISVCSVADYIMVMYWHLHAFRDEDEPGSLVPFSSVFLMPQIICLWVSCTTDELIKSCILIFVQRKLKGAYHLCTAITNSDFVSMVQSFK